MNSDARGLHLHSFYQQTYCGVGMAQHWSDLYLWEKVLNHHPDHAAIVELGSYHGGFSLFLEQQARVRDMHFRCYDVTKPHVHLAGYVELDVFRHAKQVLGYLTSFDAPVVLFCDNGNKPREAQTFAPPLPPGSVVAVHDWITETQPDDIPDCLEPLFEDLADDLGSITRFFVRP